MLNIFLYFRWLAFVLLIWCFKSYLWEALWIWSSLSSVRWRGTSVRLSDELFNWTRTWDNLCLWKWWSHLRFLMPDDAVCLSLPDKHHCFPTGTLSWYVTIQSFYCILYGCVCLSVCVFMFVSGVTLCVNFFFLLDSQSLNSILKFSINCVAFVAVFRTVVPWFSGHSYLQLRRISPAGGRQLSIEIRFRPQRENGVLLYASGGSDFVSIVLKDGFAEFRCSVNSFVLIQILLNLQIL